MRSALSRMSLTLSAAVSLSTLWVSSALGAAEVTAAPQIVNRTIGYVLTTFNWAVHTTPERTECPNGLNDGPRQHYDALFPRDGTKRKLADTELKREGGIWNPTLEPEPFPFHEPVSKVAPGFNLDGVAGENDFVSPDGEQGIDNQFYRVIGCIDDLRPGGSLYVFNNLFMRGRSYGRVLIEITEVDSLFDDDDVIVSVYRGLDPIPADATGESFLPYGTQRVDRRFGKMFNRQTRGKIKDGVLMTTPADMNFPYTFLYSNRTFVNIRDARLQLKLLPDQASGMWGGYFDVETYYRALIGAVSTNTLDYGKHDASSVFRALHRLADAYPDSKTGGNSAISAAIEVKFRQAFIEHPTQVPGPAAVLPNSAAGRRVMLGSR